MARSRTPTAKARIMGAELKHPERFADRAEPKCLGSIGAPYARMSEAEKGQWYEFQRDLPWLNRSHRVILRIACNLTVAMDGDEFTPAKAQVLSAILSKLGATPADASRISIAGQANEPDEFFD